MRGDGRKTPHLRPELCSPLRLGRVAQEDLGHLAVLRVERLGICKERSQGQQNGPKGEHGTPFAVCAFLKGFSLVNPRRGEVRWGRRTFREC